MSNMKFVVLLLFVLLSRIIFSQDLAYYKKQIDTLCSEKMYGRGYLKDGHRIAANYIEQEFRKLNLRVVQQKFPMTVNTFPEVSSIIIDDSIKLVVGKDFIPSAVSGSISGDFNLILLDSMFLNDQMILNDFLEEDLSSTVLVYHDSLTNKISSLSLEYKRKISSSQGIISLQSKALLGSVGSEASHLGMIDVLASSFPDNASTIKINVKSTVTQVTSQNVFASPKKLKKIF